MHGNRPPPGHAQAPRVFTLHYGGSVTALATVISDACWPDMYRLHCSDGTIGDLGNLTRVRDAAFTAATRGRDWRLLRWRTAPLGQAITRPLVRFVATERVTPC